MPIQIQCPSCRKSANVPDSTAGKSAKCACGTTFQIPAAIPIDELAIQQPEPVFVPQQLTRVETSDGMTAFFNSKIGTLAKWAFALIVSLLIGGKLYNYLTTKDSEDPRKQQAEAPRQKQQEDGQAAEGKPTEKMAKQSQIEADYKAKLEAEEKARQAQYEATQKAKLEAAEKAKVLAENQAKERERRAQESANNEPTGPIVCPVCNGNPRRVCKQCNGAGTLTIYEQDPQVFALSEAAKIRAGELNAIDQERLQAQVQAKLNGGGGAVAAIGKPYWEVVSNLDNEYIVRRCRPNTIVCPGCNKVGTFICERCKGTGKVDLIAEAKADKDRKAAMEVYSKQLAEEAKIAAEKECQRRFDFGMEMLENGKRDGAAAAFVDILTNYPKSEQAKMAAKKLDELKAAGIDVEIWKLKKIPEAQDKLNMADNFEINGAFDEVRKILESVINDYPNSFQAAKAKKKLKEIEGK